MKTDTEKKALNDTISEILYKALTIQESRSYPFEKLNKLSRLSDKNNMVSVFTWDTQWKNHTHTFHGFIQYYNKRKKRLSVYPLIDNADTININKLLKVTLKAEHWPGALYYQMIPVKSKGRTYYTLLGFDQNNLLISRKIIDILYFTGAGKPRFGKRIFVLGKQKQSRIIFQYSARVVMMMRYDPVYKMIVADHLAPNKPSYKGLFQFYGPDFNYIGFKFQKGKWVLQRNISVKNPR